MSAGMIIGGAAIGAASSIGTSAINAGLTSRARRQNYILNELSAQNADVRARNFYNDFQSPAAQIRQLKEAGLSPSLYYGQAGGAVGYTAPKGEGTTGLGPSQVQNPIDPLTMSQIEVNKSIANKNNADAGLTNESKEAQIAKLWADAGAAKASEDLTKAEKTRQDLENNILQNTSQEQIWKIKNDAARACSDAESAYWQALDAQLKFNFDIANFQTALDQEKARLAKLIASEELDYQQARKIVEEIWYMPDELEIKRMNAESYANYVDAEAKNLPERIKARYAELNVEKWKIGVSAVENLVKTAGYMIGAGMIGKGGLQQPKIPTTNPVPHADFNGDFKKHYHERRGRLIQNEDTYPF